MKKYPIHSTCPGPDFGKPFEITLANGEIKKYETHNPIPEGERFTTEYDGQVIEFEVDMNFSTDKNLAVVRVMNVRKSRRILRNKE